MGIHESAKRSGRSAPVEHSTSARELGPGHALDGDAQARMEQEFGTDLTAVRVHTDAAAGRFVSDRGARALTLSGHIAFAPNQYQPNTNSGNALLAHEITHVIQQGAARNPTAAGHGHGNGFSSTEGTLEAEARAAAGAVTRSTPQRGQGRRANVQLRTAARIQLDATDQKQEAITGAAADQWSNEHQIEVSASPSRAEVAVGMTVAFGLRSRVETIPQSSPYAKDWVVTEPDGHVYPISTQQDLRAHVTFTKPGSHTIEAAYRIGDNRFVFIRTTRQATDPAALLDAAVGRLARTPTTEGLTAGLERRHLELARYGLKDQSMLGVPYISSSADNPARPRIAPDLEFPQYTVTPSAGAKAFRWYVQTGTPIEWRTYHGFTRSTVNGRETYDLGSHGTTANWVIEVPNTYVIVCEELDDTGKAIGTAGRYLQVVLRDEEQKTLETWDKYAAVAKRHVGMLVPDTTVGMRAVYLNMTSGEQIELAMFIGKDRAAPNQIKIVDVTPGVSRREYSGTTVEDALNDFKNGNAYPQGFVRIEIRDNTAGISPARKTYETTGKSVAGVVSSGLGWASLGLTGLATLLTLTGVGTVAVPLLLLGAAGTGAASAGLSLYDRLRQAEIDPLGVAVDIASLASSIIGGASAFKTLAQGSAVMFTTRSGRFLLWANAVSGATAGVLMTVEAVNTINKILDDPTLSADKKSEAIVRVLAVVALNAALVGISFKDLVNVRSRVAGALGADVAGGLRTETVYTLSLLDDEALRTLAAVPKAEIEEFARVVRRNPVAATGLLRTRPFSKASEFERALETLLKSVNEPRGVFAALDVRKNPANWRLSNIQTTEGDVKVLRTEVTYSDPKTSQVRKGYFIRAYNPKTRTLQMREAFLGTLPGKVVHEGPMLTDSGTPTVTYVTLYQSRRLGVELRTPSTVTMKKIENFETICQLAWLRKKYPGKSVDALALETDSVKYGRTSIIQMEGDIVSATVRNGQEDKLSRLLDDYVLSDERGIKRTFGEQVKERVRQDQVLGRYGLSRNDKVLYGFDIELAITPYRAPAP